MRHLKEVRANVSAWLLSSNSGPHHPQYVHALARVLALIDDIEREAMGE